MPETQLPETDDQVLDQVNPEEETDLPDGPTEDSAESPDQNEVNPEEWDLPEEFYEDCGCSMSTACLTTSAEEDGLHECDEDASEGDVASGDAGDEEASPEGSDQDAEGTGEEEGADTDQDGDDAPLIPESPDSIHHDQEDGGGQSSSDDDVEEEADRTCFVATAAYADPFHPDVKRLRKFRDEWLVLRPWGRIAVDIYWKVGPVAARHVGPRPMLAKAVKATLSVVVRAIRMVQGH